MGEKDLRASAEEGIPEAIAQEEQHKV